LSSQAPDTESLAWITELSSEDRQREDARLRLRALLLRVARSELRRRACANGGNGHAPIDQLAGAATDDALAAIERDLHTYRGQAASRPGRQSSRFTRRRFSSACMHGGTGHSRRLTEHQRFVVIALALNEVPIDVLAERLGPTRGALDETLREARLAIRSGLSEASPER
jgi:RNA polymerase sigma-70 factor, ECF subfamily